MGNGNRHGVLDTKMTPAMLGLMCQQGRKRTASSYPPRLQAWKLINSELGKVIKELQIL